MKDGFFEEFKEIYEVSISKEKPLKTYTCEDCKLYQSCKSPKIKVTGQGRKRIMLVFEFPGKEEGIVGKFLVGETKRLLTGIFLKYGVKIEQDCWITSAVRCTPFDKKNMLRVPTKKEISMCRKNLLSDIETLTPNVIIVLGDIALTSLLGHRLVGRMKKGKYTDWLNLQVPDQEMKKWICCVFSPYFIKNRMNDSRKEWDINIYMGMWKKQIKNALLKWNVDVPIMNYTSRIKTITDEKKIYSVLDRYIREKYKWIAFDYETTGIKPHRKEQRILCVSISNGNESVSFPVLNTSLFRSKFKMLMECEEIGKIAHQLSFEELWTKVKLNMDVCGKRYDTLLAAHCINNRRSLSSNGLKFLVYVNFGVLGYDGDVDKYIHRTKENEIKKSGNALNCLDELELETLLKYNAEDSYFTYLLFKLQRKVLKGKKREGFNFFMEGQAALLSASARGVSFNTQMMLLS
jgi:uracil-DNA glycosylase family 4